MEDSLTIEFIVAALISSLYVLGAISAMHAVLHVKRAQSTTAWVLALFFVPLFAVPSYWAFGRNKFYGYLESQRRFDRQSKTVQEQLNRQIREHKKCEPNSPACRRTLTESTAFEFLAQCGFSGGNDVSLLINGDAVFSSIFDAIDSAQEYIIVQFYTIRSDCIGVRLQKKLLAARKRGIAVYVLYDNIGSIGLSGDYIGELHSAGAQVHEFSGNRSLIGRFRLNFRNHRKIVIVDGKTGFTGGLNVGDEYLGLDEEIGNWRDTHLLLCGPAVLYLQMSFARDWFYATDSLLEHLEWNPTCSDQGSDVLILDSGPHDILRNCGHMYANLINGAERRIWIATPYLVPDDRVLGALQLAAMRGVDVRIIVPRATDTRLFKYVPYAFIDSILDAGGRIFFYENDFMHQKIALADDNFGVVSTANFDNRSFFLNFEVSCVVRDSAFCRDIVGMLKADLRESTEITKDTIKDRNVVQRLATSVTRLFAPIL